jgi:hypothetical protein
MTTTINGSSPSITFSDSTTQTTAFTTGAVTQASLATGVAGTGPAFAAYSSTATQSITSGVDTKVQLNTKSSPGFDTNNNFDATTNYRFTPTVAGYYQINGCIRIGLGSGTTTGFSYAAIYKNSSLYKIGVASNAAVNGGSVFSVSDIVYCNGSTDYVELYGNINGTSPSFSNVNYGVGCSMSGCLVRGA